MLTKRLFAVILAGLLISSGLVINAQEKPESKMNHSQMMMSDSTMYKYMHKIASDGKLRTQMLNMMIENCQGNKEAMEEMGKTMMHNPEMNSMMMEMMHGEGMMNHNMNMMNDSTK